MFCHGAAGRGVSAAVLVGPHGRHHTAADTGSAGAAERDPLAASAVPSGSGAGAPLDARIWEGQKLDGFYVAGSFFLTGETHPFKNGNLDRVKPLSNLGENGGWGAFELTARYDKIDLSDTPVKSRAGNEASSWTAGLTWYLNPYAKILFNYIRFKGDATSLVSQPVTVPAGPTVIGTAKGDAFATRLHLDF